VRRGILLPTNIEVAHARLDADPLPYRRMKDFVGALRDYDESSFKHFEGVHIGRRALDQAAGRLRDSRGEGARRRDVAAAAGSAGSAAGAGERGGGEEARARGEVELVPASLGAEGGGGGNAVGVVGASSILEGARLEEPPVGGEAAAAAEGWRTGAGRAAGGGSGVEPAHPDAASLSLPPRRWAGLFCWTIVLCLRVQKNGSHTLQGMHRWYCPPKVPRR